MKVVIVLGWFINALGIIRALGKTRKYYLIAIGDDGKKNIVKNSRYLTQMIVKSNYEEILSWLLKNQNQYNGAIIIPTSDNDIKFLINNIKKLRKNYNCLVNEKIDLDILDKLKFHEICNKANVRTPKLFNNKTNVSFPCIIKPNLISIKKKFMDQYNKHGAYICKNSKDFSQCLKFFNKDDLIIQEYIPHGKIFCIAGYANNGEIKSAYINEIIFQRPPIVGDTIVAKLRYNETLVNESNKIISFLGYTGIFDFEFILYDNNYYCIEMNPRSCKRLDFGEKLGLKIIESAINKRKIQIKTKQKGSKVWVDIGGVLGNLVRYKISICDFIKYLYYVLFANYYADFDLNDPKPFLKRR